MKSLLSLCCLLAVCVGCTMSVAPAQPQTQAQSPQMSSHEKVYPSGTVFYQDDDGKDVPIAAGSTVVIKLHEDPHGKFVWGILENNKSIFEVLTNESKLVNEPGKEAYQLRTFTMKGTKPGKSNLKIVYFPAGQQDHAGDTATKSYRLFVEIIKQ